MYISLQNPSTRASNLLEFSLVRSSVTGIVYSLRIDARQKAAIVILLEEISHKNKMVRSPQKAQSNSLLNLCQSAS